MSDNKAVKGYDDTPLLPGSKWRIHDPSRPEPVKIEPGTAGTPDAPGEPPSDAVRLFDGKDTSYWRGKDGGKVKWKIENGYMEIAEGTGDIWTRDRFGDCQLHVEWSAPAEPSGDGQKRGNSGVFIMDLYEIQVLDGWENPTYADGQVASLYAQRPPMVNACRRPGEWQTYDIFFLAPRFKNQKLVKPAYITVVHNGVLVQLHWELLGHTFHKTLPVYDPSQGSDGPIKLQDHGDPVRYRNIWIRTIQGYEPD